MSDYQVRDYLRGRARVDPPHDFVGSVLDAVADLPQQRTAWFAPFLPAAVAVGAVAAVAVIAVLLFTNDPQVGPTPQPSPSASVQEEPGEGLLEKGDVVVMPAVDADGTFGTITIERGQTRDSYDGWETGNPWDASFVELHVEYAFDRPSVSSYGAQSFGITGGGTADGQSVSNPIYFGGVRPLGGPEPFLGNMVAGDEPIEGWIVMEVPDQFPGEGVDLVHNLNGRSSGPIDWRVPLRLADGAPPTPSPSETPVAFQPDADLLTPGNAMLLEIRSVEGVQGQITIERGEDVGGYVLVPEPSSETYFFIELFAAYDLDNGPELASWGSIDWRVEGNGLEGIEVLELYPYPVDRRPIGTWPGATVPEEAYTGWMIFPVPRAAAGENLELVYQPPGVSEPVRVPLRAAAAAPEPVDPEWPRPDPVYVEHAGLPFTVLENAEADALFVEPDTCTNPLAGYTVSYPDSWYTNTAAGDVAACSWFSPAFYELNEDGSRPEEIAIEIRVFEGAIGFIWVDLYTEDVVLDGFEARRYETGMTKEVSQPTNQLMYAYLSYLGNESDGLKLWAFTGTEYGGSYGLNQAVMDRIMASLEFTD
jgi:hypothetical protein